MNFSRTVNRLSFQENLLFRWLKTQTLLTAHQKSLCQERLLIYELFLHKEKVFYLVCVKISSTPISLESDIDNRVIPVTGERK